MITISIDWKTYKTREDKRDSIMNSIGIMDSLWYLEERKENKEPQPQEDIELPEVPEWKAFTHDWQTYDSKDYQIEKLTEFCQAISPIVNQLIKANKK